MEPKNAEQRNIKYLRVIDEAGNKQDYETEYLPRVGERILLEYGRGGKPVERHYHRVKDVEYNLQNPVEYQVRILIEEEHAPELWPE